MAEIIRSLPACLVALQGSEVGSSFPGLQVGPGQSRLWAPAPASEYELKTPPLNDAQRLEVDIFFRQVGSGFCAIVEPESLTHYGLHCAPMADGTRTTFRVPVVPEDGAGFASTAVVFVEKMMFPKESTAMYCGRSLKDGLSGVG